MGKQNELLSSEEYEARALEIYKRNQEHIEAQWKREGFNPNIPTNAKRRNND